MDEERLQLRGEKKRVREVCVVERLLPEAIAGEDHRSLDPQPPLIRPAVRDGLDHAVEESTRDAPRPPDLEHRDNAAHWRSAVERGLRSSAALLQEAGERKRAYLRGAIIEQANRISTTTGRR